MRCNKNIMKQLNTPSTFLKHSPKYLIKLPFPGALFFSMEDKGELETRRQNDLASPNLRDDTIETKEDNFSP